MEDTVKAGIGIGLLLHFLQIPIHYFWGGSWVATAALLWATQMLYLLPAGIVALVCKKVRVSQGILIVVGLTFLISVATCGALVRART